jgi:hypothetical protein
MMEIEEGCFSVARRTPPSEETAQGLQRYATALAGRMKLSFAFLCLDLLSRDTSSSKTTYCILPVEANSPPFFMITGVI